MRPNRSRPTSGGRVPDTALRVALAAVLVLGLAGCNYGFEGGGFPPHIRTIYIAPFTNETPQFDLDQLLYAEMLDQIPRRLGVRVAGEGQADAVVEGVIARYDDVAQAYNPATGQTTPGVASNEVQIGVSIRLIDIRDNLIRWESTRLIGRGTYRPDSEAERVGQDAAIASIIEQIIDGAQSQW
jgi:hypothetical protein